MTFSNAGSISLLMETSIDRHYLPVLLLLHSHVPLRHVPSPEQRLGQSVLRLQSWPVQPWSQWHVSVVLLHIPLPEQSDGQYNNLCIDRHWTVTLTKLWDQIGIIWYINYAYYNIYYSSIPGKICSFLIASLSKGLSLCFTRSDQHVKYRMPRGFPLTNSLLLDYHVKQHTHTHIYGRINVIEKTNPRLHCNV